jgi:threonine/homoserine/homoserine lactone efflux protein
MALLTFLLEAVVISLSGVMAPGPVTTVVVGKGSESPHAGALVAIGHGIVEVPLMVGVLYGVGHVLGRPHVKAAIALVGGAFLLLMGVGMFRGLRQAEVQTRGYAYSPVAAGVLLTLGNPYFLVWWATVGAALILRSVGFGLWGFAAFALVHWLCDFVWDYFLSALSFKGGQFFGQRYQQGAFLVCGAALVFFGGKFIVDGVVGLLA